MLRRLYWLGSLCLIILCFAFPSLVQAQTVEGPRVLALEAEGPLTPAMYNYIQRGIRLAESQNAELIILRLNTPGGQITLMNQIVEIIRASQVPFVVYVAPNGAMAGSAGTIITWAGHKSAMAPETAIGAASPVGSSGQDIGETMAAKEKEIIRATIRSLGQERGRSQEAIQLAEDTVQSAKAVSAQEALQVGMIDYIATNQADLLRQLDGATVRIGGQDRILHTTGIQVVPVPQNLLEQALALLTNPNIVFLLLAVGVQAILIEMASPGGWVAGFTGVIAVALAVYGMGLINVNWFGTIFILLAFVLFIVDIKAPTHGALTVAGVGSFIAGALILFNSTPLPGFPRISIPLVIGTGIFIAASFSVIISFAVRAMHLPVVTGRQTLIGQTGFVQSPLNPEGSVHVAGEMWSAELVDQNTSLPAGARVEVVAVEGLKLKVKPVR